MDLFEAIGTQRAMRRLKDDPVSDEDVWKILDAAIKAPSGGNRQPWNFIVVRDAETKRKLGEYYLDAWSKVYADGGGQAAQDDSSQSRVYRSANYLAHHLAEAQSIRSPPESSNGPARRDGQIRLPARGRAWACGVSMRYCRPCNHS